MSLVATVLRYPQKKFQRKCLFLQMHATHFSNIIFECLEHRKVNSAHLHQIIVAEEVLNSSEASKPLQIKSKLWARPDTTKGKNIFCGLGELTLKENQNSSDTLLYKNMCLWTVYWGLDASRCAVLQSPNWKELVDALLFSSLCLVENQEGLL